MLKKVGILTFHRSINYGSFLQSYSLATALNKYANCEAEVINYNMRSAEVKFFTDIVVSRTISQIPKNIIKYMNFRKVLQNNLPISNEKLISNNFDKAVSFLENKYDAIIVGSDEVWKINKLRGFPNIYWLNEKIDCIKMSYAASANRTNFNELDQKQRDYIRNTLSDFAYIGVRDQNTYDQIKEIDCKLKIEKNCDPTFMFDLEENKSQLKGLKDKLRDKYGLDPEKPMIGLMCTDEAICKAVYEKYKKNYQIVSLYVNSRHCDAYLYDLDPFEWSGVIGLLSLCVTNFFHCTVFSILNGTPFMSIDVEETSLFYESKIKDLLKRAGLLEHYMNLKHSEFKLETMFKRIDYLVTKPDKNKIKLFIDNERKYFFDFIENMGDLLNNKYDKLEAQNE